MWHADAHWPACLGGQCERPLTIPTSNPIKRVVDWLCKEAPSRIPVKAATNALKEALDAKPSLAQEKAVLILSSAVVEGMNTQEAIATFLTKSGVTRYFADPQRNIPEKIMEEFPKPEFAEDFRVYEKSIVCKNQLWRAPFWNLDLVSPDLFKSDPKLKRIVFHHKALRALIKSNRAELETFEYDANKVFASVAQALYHTTSLSVVGMAFRKTPISVWTNAFVHSIVTNSNLFLRDLPGHATVRVKYDATFSVGNLQTYFELGRVLGLMFVKGVALDNVFFERGFYGYLLDERASLAALQWDYPEQYKLLVKVLHEGAKSRKIKERLTASLSDGEIESLTKYAPLSEPTDVARVMIWHYCEGRGGEGFRRIKKGFWEVVPHSLKGKISSDDLREAMTDRAELWSGDLQAAVKYEDHLDASSELVQWFWFIAGEPKFPLYRLVRRLTGSAQVPIGGFARGNPKIVIGKGAVGSKLRIDRSMNKLFLPAGVSQDELREALQGWLGTY